MDSNNVTALDALAEDITSAANAISTYLKSLCPPHEDPGLRKEAVAGSFNLPSDAPANVQNAKKTLFEATTSIQQLISSPVDYQQTMTMNNNFLACTRWLCTFDIPTLVPPESSISYAALATAASVPESQLTRIARMAMCAGQFHEPTPNHIAHTPLSLALRSPSAAHDTMLFLTEISAPSAWEMVEMTTSKSAQTDPPISAKKPDLAFNIALQTPLSFYAYLSSNPTAGKRLASSMKLLSGASESHVRHLVSGFDWASLPREALVIDMGGSTGHVSFALASAFPHLRFVVQDLPNVIDSAAAAPPEVAERVTFQAHDFFHPQPAGNSTAAVFLIRQCLQNWPDEGAVKILRALLPSLAENRQAKIVLMNVILPSPGDGSVGQRRKAVARFRDMLGMQALGAQERGLEEWKRLVEDADERLEIAKVETPEGSVLSVMQVVLTPKEDVDGVA